jgi:serine/threonine-protein kinase
MGHEERLKAALADRYHIEREIGSGGMATVYLAEDLKHRRQVAVKSNSPPKSTRGSAFRFVRSVLLRPSRMVGQSQRVWCCQGRT